MNKIVLSAAHQREYKRLCQQMATIEGIRGARARQRHLIMFAIQHPGYQTYKRDKDTVEGVCATHNLGIIEVVGDQFRLKSLVRAKSVFK